MPTGETRKMPEEYAKLGFPFTPAQEKRIRELFSEEIANWEKKALHEARFGKPYPPKEHK